MGVVAPSCGDGVGAGGSPRAAVMIRFLLQLLAADVSGGGVEAAAGFEDDGAPSR